MEPIEDYSGEGCQPKFVNIRQAKKDGQQLISRIWYRTVFTGHGASASRMAAAMFLDTISKFLGVIEERTWRNFSVRSSQNGRRTPDCYDCRKINVCIRQELDDQICRVQLSNSLARSWTKWNKVCGNRWPKLINCISEAMNCRQFWHRWIRLRTPSFVNSTTRHLQVICDILKSTSGVSMRIGSHAFVLFSLWMRKNQTAFSHSSSAVSEAISPDAGLRMDGLPALQFGDCVSETLSNKLAKGNIERHTRERIIPSQSHFDICVFESINWYRTTKIPKPCTLNPILFVRIQCGSDPSVFQRTKPTLKIRRKNAKSQFGLFFERLNLNHSILTKIRANYNWRFFKKIKTQITAQSRGIHSWICENQTTL